VQLERFCDAGISIDMLRSEIVKQALQQGFSSRSRWLLQILGLRLVTGGGEEVDNGQDNGFHNFMYVPLSTQFCLQVKLLAKIFAYKQK